MTTRVTQADPAWVLAISPRDGWDPAWHGGLLALVVMVSVCAGLLSLSMAVSKAQHMNLLHAMMPPKVGRAFQQALGGVVGQWLVGQPTWMTFELPAYHYSESVILCCLVRCDLIVKA